MDDLTGKYDPGVRAVPAEGARVGLMLCLRCGVTLVLDPANTIDVLTMHDEFHNRLDELFVSHRPIKP